MSTYINLYANNPTKDGTDGTLISENMGQTSPLSVTLNASNNESKAIKVALRCEDGYKTSGNTVVSFRYWDGSAYATSGGNIEKWQVAADASYADDAAALAGATWASSLEISDVIQNKNYVFWVKSSSSEDEKPQTDKLVSVHVEGIVEADE